MYGKDGLPKSTRVKGNHKLAKLLAEDSTDKDEEPPTPGVDLSKPWKTEFNQYLNGSDEANGMPLPQWWRVC